jgi:hypothetical protein
MAYVALKQYHSNSVPGFVQGMDASSIYDVDSYPRFALGTGFKRQDGNIYRYASFATGTTTCTQGLLVSQTVANTCMASTDALVAAPVVALQMSDEASGTYAGAIGSRYFYFVLASTVIDQFAGGYVTITKDTGVGYCYRIKRNTAAATVNGTANMVLVELYEPLVVALSITSDISITGSLYNDLVPALYTTDHIIIGVTCANFATATTTAPKFGWVCTHGHCVCLTDGTVANGDAIQPSIVAAGAFSTYAVGTTSNASTGLFGAQMIGYAVDKAADTCYSSIFLIIE